MAPQDSFFCRWNDGQSTCALFWQQKLECELRQEICSLPWPDEELPVGAVSSSWKYDHVQYWSRNSEIDESVYRTMAHSWVAENVITVCVSSFASWQHIKTKRQEPITRHVEAIDLEPRRSNVHIWKFLTAGVLEERAEEWKDRRTKMKEEREGEL